MFRLNEFELLVEPPELLAHPVHIVGQCAQLVTVDDMDALRKFAGRHLVEARLDLLDRPDQRPGDGIAERERQRDAAERERQHQRLRGGVVAGAGLDAGDHVRLGLVDELVGQALEPIGERAGLLQLGRPRLGGTAAADQLHDLRHHRDETVVVAAELLEELDLVLGHELQPVHVVAELVELT